MLELHDEPCDEHGRRHGEDGRADNGGGNRKPFVKKNGTVLNDAYAGRHKQQGEVRQKNIDDGKRFFETLGLGYCTSAAAVKQVLSARQAYQFFTRLFKE